MTNFENEIAKFDLHSEDLLDVRREELLRLFPEVHTESGGVNFDALRLALGDSVEVGPESFGMSWPGKAECAKTIQRQSVATLLPVEDESVNWETTQNVIIEGDNLEVLKTLQKAYLGKVKMIYIDPPYNTGNDFIYPDNYTESLRTYLQYTAQVDDEGRKFSTNTESSGRFHSKWMNMMYPRLSIARDFLIEDGVIFVSIGSEEVSNLRFMLDEIYGQENFEGMVTWRRRTNQPNDRNKLIGTVSEYILVYAKNSQILKVSGVGKVGLTGNFSNPDDDPRGPWATKPWKVGSGQSGSKYSIQMPEGSIVDGEWMGEESTFLSLQKDNRIVFPNSGRGSPRKKYFKSEREEEGQCATNWWPSDEFGSNQQGTTELAEIFGTKQVFDNPKPTKLLESILGLGDPNGDGIVLDFFAGSGTTGHAVMKKNFVDGAMRKFVLVQLPEQIEEGSEAKNCGFNKIIDITVSRLKIVGKQMSDEPKTRLANPNENDFGFRVFRLDESNFAVWDANAIEGDQNILEQQLFEQVEHVLLGRTTQDILFELMLKSRYELTTPIEQIEVGKCEVWKVAHGKFVAVIDSGLTVDVLREIASWMPESVVILDRCFGADDSLKSNARKIFEDSKIDLKTV
jgi:adenine-specific DNA-methyltransferase